MKAASPAPEYPESMRRRQRRWPAKEERRRRRAESGCQDGTADDEEMCASQLIINYYLGYFNQGAGKTLGAMNRVR